MNITRRRGTIALSITLGAILVGVAIYLNINYILLHKGRVLSLVFGILLFGLLVAGVVLNTIFLVREVRRNERQDSFINAVTH
jgi:two-component system sensor histidine kinase SenX3